MPASWRQSSVDSATPVAELPSVVATKSGEDISRVSLYLLETLDFFL